MTSCGGATVLHDMNVTLKLPDEVCRKARHIAVDEATSLSRWVASLIEEEIARRESSSGEPRTWMEALTVPGMPEEFYEKDFPLPDRKKTKPRCLIEALTVPGMPDDFYEKDFLLPDRKEDNSHRDIVFEPDET